MVDPKPSAPCPWLRLSSPWGTGAILPFLVRPAPWARLPWQGWAPHQGSAPRLTGLAVLREQQEREKALRLQKERQQRELEEKKKKVRPPGVGARSGLR